MRILSRTMGSMSLPLRQPVFRRIWTASLFSNLGQQVQAVAAAWTMVQITTAPDLVALVQTALMVPIMLIALPAGAIADMYDRRKVAIGALMLALTGALLLATLAGSGLVTPPLLLGCCFLVGSGIALFSPAWQSSVAQQVGPEAMPAAVALYSISINMARSIGPAIGGLIVATAGATLAFGVNVCLYIPIIIAFLMWKRQHEPPRLPPEGIWRAIGAGVRYVRHSPPIRRVLVRTFLTAMGGSAVYSMTPLVARYSLDGGAATYGLLLGAFGVGAVGAAVVVAPLRHRWQPETMIRLCAVATGSALVTIALSRSVPLTASAMLITGASWTVAISTFNIGVQLSAPRWVAGRALATFQASVAAGLAMGSWFWGHVAAELSVTGALLVAGSFMLVSPLIGLFARMPPVEEGDFRPLPPRSEPEVLLDLTGRSGPIVLELEYRIDQADAREFYDLIRQVQRMRERNGAFGVSIARDVTQPELWIERFHYPTWHDYLRARDRPTLKERELTKAAAALHRGGEVRLRRMLERPFGSVRWKENAPDHVGMPILPLPGSTGG